MVIEGTSNIAHIVIRENRSRGTPRVRVGISVGDIRRNSRSREEPDLNRIFLPSMCVDTTSDQVESMSVGVVVPREICASGVGSVAALTCCPHEIRSEVYELVQRAHVTGMRSNLILSLFIHTL